MRIETERFLVTGGLGFIGRHLVRALVLRGATCVVIDRSREIEAIRDLVASTKVTVHHATVLSDDLAPILRDCTSVFHLAASADVRTGEKNPREVFANNVLATARLLDAMRDADVTRIAFASTSTVYGEPSVVPTPEDYAPLEPISLYGASKLACEALLSAYAHSFGIEAVVFRLANVIGGRSGHGVVHDLVMKLAKDPEKLEILGSDPGTSKSYVHVDDVILGIRAGVLAATEPVSVYNVGTEDAVHVRGIADAIAEELGLLDVRYAWTDGAQGVRGWVGDVRTMRLSVDRLKTTGWIPTMTSERAVRTAAKELWARLPRKRTARR